MKKASSKYFFILLYLPVFACNPKLATFKIESDSKTIYYQATVPKGYKMSVTTYENERTKTYLYPDSSCFFFTDNVKPSAFYPDAYVKYGKDINTKFIANDTIEINGKDDQGRYWKDRKIKYVICGYRSVPVEKKDIFDAVLNNIVVKK